MGRVCFGMSRVSLRLGHAHVLTVHRTVIHYARAASLRHPLPQILKFSVGAIHESPVLVHDDLSFSECRGGRLLLLKMIEEGKTSHKKFSPLFLFHLSLYFTSHSYPASFTAVMRASTETLDNASTVAVLASRSTVTALTPLRASRAFLTCETQC